jgi:hypothetical protein
VAIELAHNHQEFPVYRVRHAATWQDLNTVWVELPMQRDSRGNGFIVEMIRRDSLPDIGEAVLRFHYGEIDGLLYGMDLLGNVDLPDLLEHEIRIEQNIGTAADPDWLTIWWGECVAQPDQPWPGASQPIGDLFFHCKDTLYRTRRFYINRHWTSIAGSNRGNVAEGGLYGHPGFNRQGDEGRVIGNRVGSDSLGLGFDGHAWPGAGTTWSDYDALTQAIRCSTPRVRAGGTWTYLAPLFAIDGAAELLIESYQAWTIERDMPLLDFIVQVCDRRRGRGIVFADWSLSGDQLVPRLTVRAQFKDSISVTLPSGAPLSVPGATANVTTIAVDLEGDHRLGETGVSEFRVTQEHDTQYDGLETTSQAPIRVLVTPCSLDTSWAARWTSTEAAAVDSASVEDVKAAVVKWMHVYRAVGFPLSWDFKVGSQDGNNRTRCDYRMSDAGAITVPADSDHSSLLLVAIADRLPLDAGYDYSTAVVARYDAATDYTDPQAIPIMVWKRTTTGIDRWIDADSEAPLSVARAGNDGNDLAVQSGEVASRFFSEHDIDTIAMTIAVDLPYPMRMASGDLSKRVKRIRVPGVALHLAHPQAIWTLDETVASSGGYAAKRGAAGGAGTTPGILRDDRDRLARIHHLAATWYLVPRTPATWALACGGFSGVWYDADGTQQSFPLLGDLVTTLRYSGRTLDINTPVTRIEYRHATGRTTWVTSWADRDWAAG